MNLARLRYLFRQHTSSLASDLSDGDVDDYLNRAYQYTIPADVGGEMNEQLWRLECIVDQVEYPLPATLLGTDGRSPWINSVTDGATETPISNVYLLVDTDPVVFQQRTVAANSGRPTGVLFYARKATFNRPPSDRWIVNITSKGGPIALLTGAGIDNEVHGMACVTGAAYDFLTESEDEPGIVREGTMYKRNITQLMRYAQARPNQRRPARSF